MSSASGRTVSHSQSITVVYSCLFYYCGRMCQFIVSVASGCQVAGRSKSNQSKPQRLRPGSRENMGTKWEE